MTHTHSDVPVTRIFAVQTNFIIASSDPDYFTSPEEVATEIERTLTRLGLNSSAVMLTVNRPEVHRVSVISMDGEGIELRMPNDFERQQASQPLFPPLQLPQGDGADDTDLSF